MRPSLLAPGSCSLNLHVGSSAAFARPPCTLGPHSRTSQTSCPEHLTCKKIKEDQKAFDHRDTQMSCKSLPTSKQGQVPSLALTHHPFWGLVHPTRQICFYPSLPALKASVVSVLTKDIPRHPYLQPQDGTAKVTEASYLPDQALT